MQEVTQITKDFFFFLNVIEVVVGFFFVFPEGGGLSGGNVWELSMIYVTKG